MSVQISDKTSVIETSISGLWIIDNPTNSDSRGYFREVYRNSDLSSLPIDFTPVQWNHSQSHPGVLRGIHANPWYKLIYVTTGSVFAAISDIRHDSNTFQKVETFELNNKNRIALLLSPMLGNAFCVTGEIPCEYMYLTSREYVPEGMITVAWDDPDLAIKWPIEKPLLSDKDSANATLRSLYPNRFT